jgi:hypothetical protein
MHQNKCLFIFLVFSCLSTMSRAQHINTMALTPRTITSFDVSTITTAGAAPLAFIGNSAWLNYSLRDNSGYLYSLMVSTIAGSIPSGIQVHMEAGPFIGTGQAGQPTGPKLLSDIPTALVVNMGQGTTGVGQSCGHNIILSIGLTNMALLHPDNATLTLIYTLTAQ